MRYHSARHIFAAVIAFVFLFPMAGWAQEKPAMLPKKISPDISDMTPIPVHAGANTVEFWGTVSYLSWTKNQPNLNKTRIVPFHEWGTVYEFVGGGSYSYEYASTVNWTAPSYLVWLDTREMISDQNCVGPCGSIVTNEFFDGKLKGQNQTFLVNAIRQLTTPQDGGDSPSYFTAQPTIITIYSYHGGTPQSDMDKLGDPRSFQSPRFTLIDQFESNSKYCSSELALLSEIPIRPHPSVKFLKMIDRGNGCVNSEN